MNAAVLSRLVVSGVFSLATSYCLAAELVFSVTDPAFTFSIPNLPQMPLAEHPMRGTRPHLRYLGSDGPYTVSVMTPTAAGMSALDCASSTVRSLSSRPGVPPAANIFRARLNETTFVAMYAIPLGGAVQLHAHFMSAAGGTHCVEVHASRVSTSKDDVDAWFKGFGSASIEPK